MTSDVAAARASEPTPLDGYVRRDGVFDEMMGADGSVRPHWRPYLDALAADPAAGRQARSDKINRLVRETGIAYDLFTDPAEAEQPWYVDPAPLIIAPDEWRWLEAALTQRARLLNAVLSDLYGPQELLRSGRIPPRLVFSDPSFLRPCRGLAPEGGPLQFYAADLARSPDGTWWVIDDHAETPAGPGFALANRVVVTHCEGDLFRHCGARRLAPFFEKLQDELARLAGREDPSLAVLTPGPHHDDYFGHAYLARYLGCLLAEGGDLTVTGGRVYLKTLEGLRPIDLIVRCVEGAASDPLELRTDGFLGPVGLVAAVGANPNLVVNGLGSALAENRALGPYLGQLCQELLGEELKLDTAPRHWLGEAHACDRLLADLDRLVVRGVREATGRPGQGARGLVGATLSRAERESLAEEVALRGVHMVAEQATGAATTPSWTAEGLRPEPYAVRFFTARFDGAFTALPGGIAVSIDPDAPPSFSAAEGRTRDVWVLSDAEPTPHQSLIRPTVETAHLQRSGLGLQSRTADNLFWLGRYAERAEWILRLLRSALSRLEEDSGPEQGTDTLRRALATMLDKDPAAPVAIGHGTGPVVGHARTLMYGPRRDYGLQATLDHLHRLAGLTRDRLSVDAWRILNRFFTNPAWRDGGPSTGVGEALDLLDTGLGDLAAFAGMATENMTRNYGWRFLDLGRRIARAINLSELMLALVVENRGEESESRRLSIVLEMADSFMTYRLRYRVAPILSATLDLVLLDESNPRSVAFQLAAIDGHLASLPAPPLDGRRSEESRIVLALSTEVRLADPIALAKEDQTGRRPRLERLLRHLADDLPELSDALTRRYLSHIHDRPHRVVTRSHRF